MTRRKPDSRLQTPDSRLRRSLTFLILALVAACFSERNGVAGPDGDALCVVPLEALGPNRAYVTIRGFEYSPDTLTVEPGTTVTWINCEDAGAEAHTTTSDDDVWGSGPLVRGDIFEFRFDQTGTFPYFCVPHPFMRGEIRVSASAGTVPAPVQSRRKPG